MRAETVETRRERLAERQRRLEREAAERLAHDGDGPYQDA
jgi:hypothetical protein